ncbi:MAG TPA: ATP-grasp ribosomal peptide maturase [Pseudonocardiaceae bacterium]|nr:ATP-grasp ribosomal peptide maturase [Pseudonocardiaceae bacterium]
MSTPVVLVLAQGDDNAAELVTNALAQREVLVTRVDTADFPSAMSMAARPDQLESPGWLDVCGDRVDLGSVRSVYRSHPARFRFPEGMSGSERRFAMLESVCGLGGVFAAQQWRWLDHPSAVADASYKPHQLTVATKCGLNVPPSLVTNSGAEARKFAAEVGGELVYKSLSTGVVAERDELRIIYTTRLADGDLDESNDQSFELCPILLQRWVPKVFDVRLTVVGPRCFAVAVHTESSEARVDWRSRYEELSYQICSTPDEVRCGVLAYLRRFGLTFGAFDFSITAEGHWWFLECNPAGRWSWIFEETGVPIAEAIADELTNPT